MAHSIERGTGTEIFRLILPFSRSIFKFPRGILLFQVVNDEAPPPSYAQAIERLQKPIVLNVEDLETGVSPAAAHPTATTTTTVASTVPVVQTV